MINRLLCTKKSQILRKIVGTNIIVSWLPDWELTHVPKIADRWEKTRFFHTFEPILCLNNHTICIVWSIFVSLCIKIKKDCLAIIIQRIFYDFQSIFGENIRKITLLDFPMRGFIQFPISIYRWLYFCEYTRNPPGFL